MHYPCMLSSQSMKEFAGNRDVSPTVEFIGNLSSVNYMVGAIWVESLLTEYISAATGSGALFKIDETAIGSSGTLSDFEIAVPGLLVISIIMLMFTASLSFVTEVEQKTIIRLRN